MVHTEPRQENERKKQRQLGWQKEKKSQNQNHHSWKRPKRLLYFNSGKKKCVSVFIISHEISIANVILVDKRKTQEI